MDIQTQIKTMESKLNALKEIGADGGKGAVEKYRKMETEVDNKRQELRIFRRQLLNMGILQRTPRSNKEGKKNKKG